MSEIVGKWHGNHSQDNKTKTKPMPLGITEPEALVMTTILAKVVFHTSVEGRFCNNDWTEKP